MKIRQISRTTYSLGCLVLVVIMLSSCTPSIDSDKQMLEDTNLQAQILENGMKYYFYPTDVSPDSILLQVTIRTGSLYETNEELGLSHYIEHMAFNSTEKYNREQFETIEQNLGISFGSHSNAYTSFDTVNYYIKLQNPTPERLDAIFDIMSQRTLHIKFDPHEVEDERAIILSEKNIRYSSPYWNRFDFFQNNVLAGTEYPEHLPIGTEEVLKTATSEHLRTLYEKWYVPSRIAVSVIGDVDAQTIQPYIKTYFESVASRETGDDPSLSELDTPSISYHGFYDVAVKNPQIQIMHLEKIDIPSTNRLPYLKKALAEAVLSEYFERRATSYITEKQSETSIQGMSHSIFPYSNVFEMSGIFIEIKPEALEKGIPEVQNFIAGFYAHLESPEALEAIQSIYDEYIDRLLSAPQTPQTKIAQDIVDNFIHQYPVVDTKETIKEYQTVIKKSFTNEDFLILMDGVMSQEKNSHVFLFVGDANKNAIKDGKPIVDLNMPLLYSKTISDDSFNFVSEEISIETLAGSPKKTVAISEEFDEDLDLYTWKLDNGQTVFFKQVVPTDENEAQLVIQSFNQPLQKTTNAGKFAYAEEVLNNMWQYHSTEGQAFINIIDETQPTVNLSAQGIEVETNKTSEIEEAFKIINVVFRQRFEEESFAQAKTDALRQYDENLQNPYRFAIDSLLNTLQENSPFYYDRLDKSILEKTEFEDVQTFASHLLSSRDTVFFIVGNLSSSKAKTLTEQWIASINTNTQLEVDYQSLSYPLPSEEIVVERIDNKDISHTIYLLADKKTAGDPSNPNDSPVRLVASEYLSNAMLKKIREEEGYSYQVSASISSAYHPIPSRQLVISYSTEPTADISEAALTTLKEELSRIATIDKEDLEASKTLVINSITETWEKKISIFPYLSVLFSHYNRGENISFDIEKIKNEIQKVSPAQVSAFIMEMEGSSEVVVRTFPYK